jgi:hypothetical protein
MSMAGRLRDFGARLCAAGLMALGASVAIAQDGAIDMTGMGIYAMEDAVMEAAGGRTASASPALRRQFTAPPAARAPSVGALPYRTDDAVRQKVVRLFFEKGPKTAAYVSDIRQFVASGRVFREFAGVAPKLGLRTGDAVDAYAFYLLAQWGVANDYRPEPTRAQVVGIRAQASRALASLAGALATSAARQEFAETLVAQGVLIAAAHESAVKRGDAATIRLLVSSAHRGGVKVFGTDPTRLALTNAGFRAR